MTYDRWKTTPADDPYGPEPEPTPEEERITWLDALMQRVTIRQDDNAPCGYAWCATLDGFDLQGVGRTELEALVDLNAQLEKRA